MTAFRNFWIVLIFSGLSVAAFSQHDNTQQGHPKGSGQTGNPDAEAHHDCGHLVGETVEGEFNAGATAVHHISDANAIHLYGHAYLHLPCILYAPGHGWTLTTTSAFHAHHHGNGEVSKDGYVLVEGSIMRIKDPAFATGEHPIEGVYHKEVAAGGKTKTIFSVVTGGECKELEAKTTFDGGVMGGGITGFYDFSITRNVFTMFLTALLLFFLFRSAATAAMRREGQAPKGIQNFLEPFYIFIRDEVAKPSIGPKYEKYMPYLLSAFFFILGLNLIGQIPFFPGSANLTGNISVTIVLAVLTFLLTMLSSNKHFWEHTLWMPGIPPVLKIFILTPVEILGIFLKPFTLLLRLFANITAGHIVVLCFVGLIFIFGGAGTSISGTITGALTAIPLTLFMMALELLVAFLQAFIFTMLSATYIGMALEEPHHH
ncbi:MAG: F0F1 ATP synthase subunit A [Lewinellaceae bacterium]|nr:F0F1 ATP synthase subunit A [Saprospiraceae bacterium]MCB0543545.1 F0F1 ATP synthase subunit A [Saprospiraceae bacterium]MCB9306997.1 F0F1 ATP synthase subunit A [Lewinellaceae bacterium]MCB9355932.1 F0F1 ATP synthase subunit A [Lewinellaceae bacterium]